MAIRLHPVLLIIYTCFVAALSCSSCSSGGKTREQTITDDFETSENVYTAIVSSADCKCFPAYEDPLTCPTVLDCVNYAINDSGVIVENVRKRYECSQGFPCPINNYYDFQECQDVEEALASSSSVDLPVTNVAGEENCSVVHLGHDSCEYSYKPCYFNSTEAKCDLSTQPCYYNVTVTTVYKGNFVPGDILTTHGRDVLSNCANHDDSFLMLGVEYVVGIGGSCAPLKAWSTLESYSESEVALLQACAENPSSCNSTMGTDPTLPTFVVTTSDTDPVTMGTDLTLDPVATTSETETVTVVSNSALPVFHHKNNLLFALVIPFFNYFMR